MLPSAIKTIHIGKPMDKTGFRKSVGHVDVSVTFFFFFFFFNLKCCVRKCELKNYKTEQEVKGLKHL